MGRCRCVSFISCCRVFIIKLPWLIPPRQRCTRFPLIAYVLCQHGFHLSTSPTRPALHFIYNLATCWSIRIWERSYDSTSTSTTSPIHSPSRRRRVTGLRRWIYCNPTGSIERSLDLINGVEEEEEEQLMEPSLDFDVRVPADNLLLYLMDGSMKHLSIGLSLKSLIELIGNFRWHQLKAADSKKVKLCNEKIEIE